MSDTPRTDSDFALIQMLEHELMRARNEIARMNGQTRWQCSCGGTDCEGKRENEELRARFDRLRTALEERTDAYNIASEERDALRTKLHRANEAALRAMNAKVPLIADNARLVAELAELHKQFDALRNSQQQP